MSEFRRKFLELAGNNPQLLTICRSLSITDSLLEETKLRCCHDVFHEVYQDFINAKDATDWLHEYAFAAKVVTYTSQKFAKIVQQEFSLRIDEALILKEDSAWNDWEKVIENYYRGLMFPDGETGLWRAPFLMPRIVLLRSKPILPSAEDVETMCAWLKGIEDRVKRNYGT